MDRRSRQSVLLNVLMLAPMVPPDCYGGAGRSTLELIEGLSLRGIYTYALSPTAGANSLESKFGCDVERVAVGNATFNSTGIVRRRRAFRERLKQLLPGARFDLVHDSGGYLYGDVLHDLRSYFQGPILVQFRTSLPELFATFDPGTFEGFSASTVRNWVVEQERRAVRAADHIVCLARHVADRIQLLYSVPSVVIRTGLRPSGPKNKNRPKVIKVLLAGRLDDPNKGAAFGLAVLRGLIKARNGIEGIVTSTPDDQKDDARIRFVGSQSFAAFDELMHEVNVVLVPSVYDCSPRVVLEAMRCGHLTVARESLGTREIIETGRNGLLFSSDADPDGVVNQVLRVLNDWDCVTELGRKASEAIALRYDFEAMVTSTIEAYRRTIDAAKSRQS